MSEFGRFRTKTIRDAEKERARENLAKLRKAVKSARVERDAAREAVKEHCRVMREAARSTCSIEKASAESKWRPLVAKMRASLADERKFQEDLRRIEAGNRQRAAARPRASKKERQGESDDEVRSNIPDDLVPLWERVKRSIKGSARMSRTEAFLKYAEEHPGEVVDLDAIEDQTDALVAELERQQRSGRRNPELVELGKLTAITWKGGSKRWPLRRAPSLVVIGKRLLIVYPEHADGKGSKGARRIYSELHWGQTGAGERWTGVAASGPFKVLGVGRTITYTTRKGTSELVDWVHEWGEGARGRWTPPTVVAHVCRERGCLAGGTIALRGGTYRVTERGIVG
jgi:hypothetical protein